MQSAGSSLPEFHRVRCEDVAAPVRRKRDLAFGILRLQLLLAILQPGATRDAGALFTDPRADLAAVGTTLKIRIRFLATEQRHRAPRTDLTLAFLPKKGQRCLRVRREFAAFATVVVGEEREAAGIEALQQDGAARWLSLGGHGGERHRIRLHHAGGDGILKPHLEKHEGILRERGLVERALFIIQAQVREIRFASGRR